MEKKGLKIIAGSLRGKKLVSLPGHLTRPLLGRIRKSLFDIVGSKVVGARFLDLFAGTGSVGIEALSRGAKYVLFVEKESLAVKVIRKNLEKCRLQNRADIITADILKEKEKLSHWENFDLIFVAPPYKLNLIKDTLRVVLDLKLLQEKGLIICQHHFKEKVPRRIGPLVLSRSKRYGKTVLSFFTPGQKIR